VTVDSERYERVSKLFTRALELDGEQRDDFLSDACHDDPDLRAEVESLLAHDRNASGVLQDFDPGCTATTAAEDKPIEPSTSRIGPYRVLELLGTGGMGEVYLVEQDRPIRRKLAVKLIKPGMDSRQVIARFEAERQALALMNHPGIAKVHEAGTDQRGRPYFAMEFVRGVPINLYCDNQRLTTTERLELFIEVCNAVEHAHQKGVIHRDLKPSNVLVTLQGKEARPKIIDFGVAKATAQRLTERSLFTEMGVLIGTPEYMSPEQAEMSGLDVDTRSDVYSLGVILYELLVGALPFEPDELRKANFDEIRRRISEEEPPKPSKRVSTLGDAMTESVLRRRTDLAGLRRQLRGDLDWITMKALEKDRTRRYGSPSGLADDIRRHLNHEPVGAGPAGAAYRTRKFVRRHRLGVAAGALVVFALAIALAGTTFGLIRATRAEARAQTEATAANQVSEFLVDLFDVSDPNAARGEEVTAREVLDRGVERIDGALEAQPAVRARMLGTLGRVYSKLGLLADAEPLLDEAVRLERTLPVADRIERNTRYELAWTLLQRGRYDDAEQILREDYEERVLELGENHPWTARSMAGLGNLYRIMRRLDEAEALLIRAVEINDRVAEDDETTLPAKANLAAVYIDQGRFEEAAPLLNEALTGFRRTVGDGHVKTLATQRLIGENLVNLGRYDEAERVLTDCLNTAQRVLGPDHPRSQETLNDLADLHKSAGDYAEARRFYRESLRIIRNVRGEDHPLAFRCLNGLGDAYRLDGRLDEAESILSDTLKSARRSLGEHPEVGEAARYLALVSKAQGRLEDADRLMDEAATIFRKTAGGVSRLAVQAQVESAGMKMLLGERRRALDLLALAVDLGYAAEELTENPDFASLREDPEFLALAARER
jgi:non-specific serine/threonine protein kinase/serine/threonine-protein kinase